MTPRSLTALLCGGALLLGAGILTAPAAPAAPAAPSAAPSDPARLRAFPLENPVDPTKPLVRLRWTAPATGAAPTSYRVYVDDVLFETTSLTRSNVSTLTLGQRYTFRVTAVNAEGESAGVTVERNAIIAPSMPLDVQVVPDQRSLHVSWQPPIKNGGVPIRRYIVEASSMRPGPPPECVSTSPTSCTISGLTNGMYYDVTVIADNGGWPWLQGQGSAPALGIPNARPSGPRNFRVISAGSTTVSLGWSIPQNTGPSPILGYTISVFNNEGVLRPEYPQVNVGPGVRSYRLTGLTPGLPYQFGVQAYTALNAGAMTVNALHNPLGLPAAPSVVDIAGVGNTTVSLTWEPPDPDGGVAPSHYRITAIPQGTNPPGVLTQEIVCPVKATNDAPDFECAEQYLWMNLVNGITYSFTVAAKNKFGWGPTSTYPAFATPEGTPPPPLISAATITSPTSITLSWDPSVTRGGEDVGEVTYTVTLDGDPVCRDISGTTCVLSGLVQGQDYEVEVMAINEVFGGGELSTSSLIVNTNPVQGVLP